MSVRGSGESAPRRARPDSGETLAFLVLWPTLLTAILLLVVHAFIVTNARAQAEVAASAGLRAAWQFAANSDFVTDGQYEYNGYEPHPKVLEMRDAVEDAVAQAAAAEGGWRWWSPHAATVQSDWCAYGGPGNPNIAGDRPTPDESGWVRIVVSGEVYGPLAALWPNRFDRVYAVATGPAVPNFSPAPAPGPTRAPVDLPTC